MNQDLEIRHLRETIAALREELEKTRFEERDHIQQAVAAANDEGRQLRASIVELRDRMELREAHYQEKLRDIELQHHRERTELQRTIATLRKALDKLHESAKKTGSSGEIAPANTSL